MEFTSTNSSVATAADDSSKVKITGAGVGTAKVTVKIMKDGKVVKTGTIIVTVTSAS